MLFLLVNGGIIFLLRGVSDDIAWQKDLRGVDDAFARGDHAAAANGILQFGERWPNARTTYGWNEKAARYLDAAGRTAEAAAYYGIAADIRPQEPGIHARTGDAHFRLGNHEEAAAWIAEELVSGDRDNDLANMRMGQLFLEEGDIVLAFRHFARVQDRERWKAELGEAAERLRAEVLDPARQAALARAAASPPDS